MKRNFFSLSDKIIELINGAITVIISLAVLGFMWGIVKFLFNAGNEKARKEGRAFMLYGILTLFVMTSLWGLVRLLGNTITLETEDLEKYITTDEETGSQYIRTRDGRFKISEDSQTGSVNLTLDKVEDYIRVNKKTGESYIVTDNGRFILVVNPETELAELIPEDISAFYGTTDEGDRYVETSDGQVYEIYDSTTQIDTTQSENFSQKIKIDEQTGDTYLITNEGDVLLKKKSWSIFN